MPKPSNMVMVFKCRKCRVSLFSEEEACNSHGQSLRDDVETEPCIPVSQVCYLKEESAPVWMKDQLDHGNWMKGKLFCPSCNSRLGSYDFVGGPKCQCGEYVLPSLHVVSNKVDKDLKLIDCNK